MGRSIVAVVVSYLVMSVLIIGVFMGLWMGMGPDRLLKPGSWQGGMLLTVAAPGITLLAGLFGGWMCAKIGRGRTPAFALAAVVFVLGVVSAAFTLQKPFPADPRPEGMTVTELFEKGREPTWVAVSNPILGALAVVVGGLLGARPKAEAAA